MDSKPVKRKRIQIEDEQDEILNTSINQEESDEEMIDEIDTNTEAYWERSTPPTLNPSKDSIVFQKMDIQYTIGDGDPEVQGPLDSPVPRIHVFGLTMDGISVMVTVEGFTPYFFVPAPSGFRDSDIEPFREELNKRLETSNVVHQNSKKFKTHCMGVEVQMRESIMGYHENQKSAFLRISVASPKLVPPARTILETGILYKGKSIHFLTYESNIPFVMRMMIDTKMVGCGWIEIPAGSYHIIPPDHKLRFSTCQYEVNVLYERIIPHHPEGEWAKIAPLRILSFDIECAGRKGVFPEPEHDPVIQIASVVTLQGSKKPILKNVFTLRNCSPIIGAQVFCFKTEKELLSSWRNFFTKVDPDIVTGYNIMNFDLYYLILRAKKIGCSNFPFLTRVKDKLSKLKDSTFSSKAYGTRESKEVSMDGRVPFDVLQVIQRDHKLRSYSLNFVSAHFLNQQKEDVHHSNITTLFNGSDEDRTRLAVYCLKDSELPLLLLEKLMCVINYIEMARVTGVPFSFLLSRGQQVKVISQLYRRSMEEGLLIPALDPKTTEEKYKGAIVIEPQTGFYKQPIATLDFSSLYPSIMMAHNLCYSTLIRKSDVNKLNREDYEVTPSQCYFVKSHVRKGLLPKILEDLIAARARVKQELKSETDPFQRAVLDGRQLALKVSANSVYGFTGASVGKLPCLEISSSVTAYGREMLEYTKKLVEEKYTIENGYQASAKVIYGDTDSVMVDFGVSDIKDAMAIGLEASKFITDHYHRPIKLEFEKVYYPFLLMNKKRYAGLYWTNPQKYDKMDCKGIETVRRDNCPLVKYVISNCLDKILIEKDVEGAITYAKQVISDLLCNKLDLSLLVISKALSKSGNDYTSKQAHAELAERMKKRDAGTAPNVGDRVPYVITKSQKNAKTYQKSEDPLYVLENNIPLDTEYYLQKQLANPLMRLFEPIMDNPQSLLSGSHTRSITKPTPTATVGGIVGFTVKKLTCLGCRTTLPPNETGLCKYCKPRQVEIYTEKLSQVNKLENNFSSVWTQCQRCQGSLHNTVLCSNRDCPIFYMRKKIQKDLTEATNVLERLSF